MNDIFCDIIANQDARPYLYEDDDLIIINSRFPTAEQHFLVIPKKHIDSIIHASDEDVDVIGKMIIAAKNYIAKQGIADYKLLFNAGKYVEVPHLHLHVLCGEIKAH
jgi:histidine triad (HIT) family protein